MVGVGSVEAGSSVGAQARSGAGEFVQYLTRRGSDDRQCILGVVRAGADQVGGDTGLDVDDRDAVGNDVMEFTGDVQPFLGDSPARFLLACGLGALGPLFSCLDGLPATSNRIPGGDGECRPRQTGEEFRTEELTRREDGDAAEQRRNPREARTDARRSIGSNSDVEQQHHGGGDQGRWPADDGRDQHDGAQTHHEDRYRPSATDQDQPQRHDRGQGIDQAEVAVSR